MTATTLNLKSHLALLGGKVGPMIGLSQAAQRGTAASAEVRALAAELEARGHALAGDGDNAHRKLDQAASLIGNAAGDPEAGPPWIHGYSPAYLTLQRGFAYFYLDRNARAVEWLSAGLTEMRPEAGQSEWIAWYHVRLAVAHARAGDPEQACSVAAQAALIARRTGSSRVSAQLDRLLAQLSARWPALSCRGRPRRANESNTRRCLTTTAHCSRLEIKRAASAVGDGATVVRLTQEYVASEHAGGKREPGGGDGGSAPLGGDGCSGQGVDALAGQDVPGRRPGVQ